MTAYNPHSVPTDDDINRHAQEALVAEVASRWPSLPGEGFDPKGKWAAEASILILGITLDDARALAVKYRQNAFLFGDSSGRTELMASNPEEQHMLMHPLARTTHQINRELRESGFRVVERTSPASQALRVNFVPRRKREVSNFEKTELTGCKDVPIFCMRCAKEAFSDWKGWCSFGTEKWTPKRKQITALPDIPEMLNGKCPSCDSNEPLSAERIYYLNYHSPYNTGLPDYFTLEIAEESLFPLPEELFRWGKPYREPGIKRACSQLNLS